MRNFTKRMALFVVLLLAVAGARCEEKVVYKGICFTIRMEGTGKAYVEPLDEGCYSGDVVIPESFSYPFASPGSFVVGAETYTVIGIEPEAFRNCEELVSVSIPKTVTESMDASWFNGCRSLESINVDSDNSEYASADGVLYDKEQEELIRVPEGKSFVTLPNTIRSIGDLAFLNCDKLASVTLPAGVSYIGEGLFDGCSFLTEINVVEGGYSYSSIDGVLYNGLQTEVIRVPEGVESVKFSDDLYRIGKGALKGCWKLQSVELPPDMFVLEDSVFKGCIGLTSVTIPKYVESVGMSAFEGCVKLTSVEFLSSLENIGTRAFYGCSSLSSIVIPASVYNIWAEAFTGCTGLKSAVVLSPDINWGFEGSGLEKVYYVHSQTVVRGQIPEDYDGAVYGTQEVLEQFADLGCTKVKWFDFDARLGTFSFSNICDELQFEGASCFRLLGNGRLAEEYEVKSEGGGVYEVDGVLPGKTYQVTAHASLDGMSLDLPFTVETLTPTVEIPEIVERTQTTVTLTFSLPMDDTCFPADVYVQYDLVGGKYGDSGSIVVDDYKGGTYETVISGLHPGREYNIYVSANYRNKYDNSNFSSQRDVACSTLDLLPDDLVMELHPTSVKITGTYVEGDATVLTTGFSHFYDNATLYRNEQPVNGLDVRQEGKNTILEATGLHPEKKYCLWYFVETQEGGRDSVVCEFTTPELEFSTLPAKATSNTVALICAETNLSDRETGAGFEWRRYDAPDLVPSDQSPCPVVDGVLTGALRNLSASTYYKFRPYYTSASGETYYGEWLAFSTADAYVYFDPTVRTYEATGVTATEARVRGYAIAGSDDITEQGFEYWPTEAASKRAATDVQRVQATGQFMTATLEDLQPGTVYTFRVYVETVKGTTYGEEQVFTTESGGTAISDIESDVEAEDLQMTVRKVGNKIFVRVTGYDAGMAVWTLTALNGAVLAERTVTADGSWQPLNVSGLSRGVYLLTARSLQSASTVKFSLF